MTAVACLRVAVEADRTGLSPAVLGPLVAKFASAYLETRWVWPRKFAPLTYYSFLLTDPRADEMDVQELARLSDELQTKLFGEAEEGEVALLLFEGPPEAVTAFAALDAATVMRALHDPSLLPPGGRLSRIDPEDNKARPDVIAVKRAEPDEEQAGPAPAKPQQGPAWVEQHLIEVRPEAEPGRQVEMPHLEGVQGIYFTARSVFIGDVVSSTPGSCRTHFSVVEGEEHMPSDPQAFDADCVSAALHYLEGAAVQAMLFIPICYTNIIRATRRAAYEEILSQLPPDRRNQLAAAVYDAPRDPAFNALAQLRSTLSKYFTHIDLRTPDPGFEIEKLSARAVNSVTMVLPNGDQRTRLAALRRYCDRLELYKKKQVWAAVTNVRSKIELEACARLNVPFVTGPAVCRMQTAPVGGRALELSTLPVLAA